MKKSLKKLGLVITIATSMVLSVGCGKKDEKKMVQEMIDKYSAYCDLADYKGIEYLETKTVITKDDVQYQVDSLLEAYATSTEVTTGTVGDGDTVNIDFLGKVDGVAFEGGSTDGAGYELTLGSGMMIDGFEEQIMGHSVGETFDIYVTFPEEYTEELAGKDAVFTITINSKIDKVYPEYTDAFVAANTEYETIAAYEEYLMTAMTENAKASDDDYNKTAVMTAVIDATTINEYPQQDMQKMIDDTMDQIESQAVSYGYELNDYIVGYYGMSSVDEFEKYVSEVVKSYMSEKIVVCSIAKAENMTVTDEEIAAYKTQMMETLGITDEKAFDESYTAQDVAYYTLADKVVNFLLENGTPVDSTTEATPETATDAAE